ncbi:MAG TPA: GntR family transcriptional regulator [Stellaceae bacterium]|nr:GntR family transcriptional regulator [Stellaceae bacterium]
MQRTLDALRIEPSGVPIYVQIREQLLGAIGAGWLAPGAQMPTMRQVAVALRVDLNTVRHAYDELDAMGAIRTVRGVGTFVAERPPRRDLAAEAARIDSLAHRLVAMAMTEGVDPVAVAHRVLTLEERQEQGGEG